MKNTLLTILRDKNTGTALFRETAEKMAHILAHESFQFLTEIKKSVNTPLQKTAGYQIKQGMVLVPILRAGLSLLPVFLEYYQDARVGFLGLKRDEETAVAHEYYRNLPKINKNDLVIVLDPMIATGGSAVSALEMLKKYGAKEDNIVFVSLFSVPEGLKKIKDEFPKVKIITGVTDEKLNQKKYILPGVGDFGDRFFGTV